MTTKKPKIENLETLTLTYAYQDVTTPVMQLVVDALAHEGDLLFMVMPMSGKNYRLYVRPDRASTLAQIVKRSRLLLTAQNHTAPSHTSKPAAQGAMCEYCGQNMRQAKTCTIAPVEFPDGTSLPPVPYSDDDGLP